MSNCPRCGQALEPLKLPPETIFVADNTAGSEFDAEVIVNSFEEFKALVHAFQLSGETVVRVLVDPDGKRKIAIDYNCDKAG